MHWTGNESKFIQEITQAITRIVNRTYLNVAKHPIGVESRVHAINMLLSVGMNDIRMIGVFGVGGIGKTTITKAIYNLNAYQFEDSCFLANVRETSKRECGLVQLQEKLLYDILRDSSLKVDNVDRGINVIKERLCCKRILLVLDDVDQLAQLEALSGESGWFGLGSRIIITTRDKHLLTKHKVGLTYKVKEMDHNEALQLFSWHAFKKDKPINGFVQLSERALRCARGLPLALVVLGSDLNYDTAIKELPSSVGNLSGLRILNLGGCKDLMHLPSSIFQLKQLKELYAYDCSNLTPSSSIFVAALEFFNLKNSAISKLDFFTTLEIPHCKS